MSRYAEYQQRERERVEMEEQLRRGSRQVNESIRDLDGWASRIMASILRPLKNNLDRYPIGHGVPFKGNGGGGVNWNNI